MQDSMNTNTVVANPHLSVKAAINGLNTNRVVSDAAFCRDAAQCLCLWLWLTILWDIDLYEEIAIIFWCISAVLIILKWQSEMRLNLSSFTQTTSLATSITVYLQAAASTLILFIGGEKKVFSSMMLMFVFINETRVGTRVWWLVGDGLALRHNDMEMQPSWISGYISPKWLFEPGTAQRVNNEFHSSCSMLAVTHFNFFITFVWYYFLHRA